MFGFGGSQPLGGQEEETALVIHGLGMHRLRKVWYFSPLAREVRHPPHEGPGVEASRDRTSRKSSDPMTRAQSGSHASTRALMTAGNHRRGKHALTPRFFHGQIEKHEVGGAFHMRATEEHDHSSLVLFLVTCPGTKQKPSPSLWYFFLPKKRMNVSRVGSNWSCERSPGRVALFVPMGDSWGGTRTTSGRTSPHAERTPRPTPGGTPNKLQRSNIRSYVGSPQGLGVECVRPRCPMIAAFSNAFWRMRTIRGSATCQRR